MSIGDVRALIHSENREFIAQTKERFANFVGDGLDISLGIEVEVLPPENRERILASARVRPEVTFNCSRGRWTIAWHGLSGEIDLKSGEGEMGCDLSPVALNSFLRFACSLSLLKEAGFLVHAASLTRNGKGYIFPGKSGAGKTTISSAQPGATLLTDEISLIKMANGVATAFGTPFWGDLGVGDIRCIDCGPAGACFDTSVAGG